MKQKAIFKISGMSCHSCASVIEYSLKEERGIDSVSVDFNSQRALLEFYSEQIDANKIKNLIEKLGYKAFE